MKRKLLMKLLAEAGFTFKEGGNHTKIFNREGKYITAVPRHPEIKELTARAILKETGIKL